MKIPPVPCIRDSRETMVQEHEDLLNEKETSALSPHWLWVLSRELHWSFVFAVVVVNGINHGLGGAVCRVATDYYWKDVQKVQPSEAQVYQGITSVPWIVKPLWGLLTDVLPLGGYRRRPYLVLAGVLGIISMLTLCLYKDMGVALALLTMTLGSASWAIADVMVDACVAQNSINHPSLATDMQSLCGLSSSIGGLLGFFISGLLLEAMSSQDVLGLLSVPAALVILVGLLLLEPRKPNFEYKQIYQTLLHTNQTMWSTLKHPAVWRSCLYMYASLALSLNIQEGMFYWYTDRLSGPSFSQKTIGFISSIGSVGSLLGVLLYQNILKDYHFRSLLLWSQLLLSFSGTLDLVLVLRLNSKFGVPDYFFAVIDESVSQMIGRIKWMPILVLSSKLCPSGIEGTFFALLMSIDHIGMLTSSWGGGVLLQALKVTRTEFSNLWAVILIRNFVRLLPIALISLVPRSDQHSAILSVDKLIENEATEVFEDKANDV